MPDVFTCAYMYIHVFTCMYMYRHVHTCIYMYATNQPTNRPTDRPTSHQPKYCLSRTIFPARSAGFGSGVRAAQHHRRCLRGGFPKIFGGPWHNGLRERWFYRDFGGFVTQWALRAGISTHAAGTFFGQNRAHTWRKSVLTSGKWSAQRAREAEMD